MLSRTGGSPVSDVRRCSVTKGALILCAVSGQAEAVGNCDSTKLPYQTVSFIRELLQAPTLGGTKAALRRLAEKTSCEGPELRLAMIALVDSLDRKRVEKTEGWKRVTAVGPPGVEEKVAEKFLKYLLKESRDTLEKDADRPLWSLVNKAGRRAGLSFDGQALLAFLLARMEQPDTPAVDEADPVRVVVEARPHYYGRFDLSVEEQIPVEKQIDIMQTSLRYEPENSLYRFFGVRNAEDFLERASTVHDAIITALVDNLPMSKHIDRAWKHYGGTSKADYRLIVKCQIRPSKPDENVNRDWMIGLVCLLKCTAFESDESVFSEVFGFEFQSDPISEGEEAYIASEFASRLARTVDSSFENLP